MSRRRNRFGHDFDPNLDRTLWEKQVPGDRGYVIAIRVKSYNRGAPKLALERPGDGQRFHKLGRLSFEEAAEIAKVWPEALTVLSVECAKWSKGQAPQQPAYAPVGTPANPIPLDDDEEDDEEAEAAPAPKPAAPARKRRLAALGRP